MINRRTISAALLALALTSLSLADVTKPNYAVTNTLKIGGDGGWDYAVINPATRFLYTSRSTHTQVIDADTGKVVFDLPKCGAHGIALALDQSRGYTSDGRIANTATVFDLHTHAILYTLPTGKNPDAIVYDSSSKKLFTMNGGSNNITVIDTTAATPNLAVIANVPVDGKPEFAVVDGAGHLYVNIEDKNEIQDIEIKSLTIAHTWKIDGQSPSGLAIDIKDHVLFSGCDSKMVVIDYTTGKTISTPTIGEGVDACAYDPGTAEAFASCGDGTLAVIKQTSPGKFETVQTVTTKPSARTMALDAVTHTIYLPSAELLPIEAGAKYPKPKPGTFAVLVVSEQK